MKLAVHLHLYYLDQLPKVLKYLMSLNGQPYDLFVTMVKHNKQIEETIKAFNPNTKVIIVPNRGYDLAPFIEFLHKIDLDQYDLILKVHTKAPKSRNFTVLNGHNFTNRLWNHVLWDAVLGSKDQAQQCLARFKNKEVGMIGSGYCLTREKRTYEQLLPGINEALKHIGFKPVTSTNFIAGTIFYVRAALMKPLLAYSAKDFPQTDGTVKNYTFAHIMERVLAETVTQSGHTIIGVDPCHLIQIKLWQFHIALCHFLYQKKITNSGALMVKVCRLTVYHKKGYQHV